MERAALRIAGKYLEIDAWRLDVMFSIADPHGLRVTICRHENGEVVCDVMMPAGEIVSAKLTHPWQSGITPPRGQVLSFAQATEVSRAFLKERLGLNPEELTECFSLGQETEGRAQRTLNWTTVVRGVWTGSIINTDVDCETGSVTEYTKLLEPLVVDPHPALDQKEAETMALNAAADEAGQHDTANLTVSSAQLAAFHEEREDGGLLPEQCLYWQVVVTAGVGIEVRHRPVGHFTVTVRARPPFRVEDIHASPPATPVPPLPTEDLRWPDLAQLKGQAVTYGQLGVPAVRDAVETVLGSGWLPPQGATLWRDVQTNRGHPITYLAYEVDGISVNLRLAPHGEAMSFDVRLESRRETPPLAVAGGPSVPEDLEFVRAQVLRPELMKVTGEEDAARHFHVAGGARRDPFGRAVANYQLATTCGDLLAWCVNGPEMVVMRIHLSVRE
jgi:hypothetical protein